jgi:hypothetical protein
MFIPFIIREIGGCVAFLLVHGSVLYKGRLSQWTTTEIGQG